MHPRRSPLRNLRRTLLFLALLCPMVGSVGIAQQGRGGPPKNRSGRPPFAGVQDPAQRRSLLEAWKAKRMAGARSPAAAQANPPGTPYVGRASMVINGAGTIVYTKNFLATNCDQDLGNSAFWTANTAHALHDHVHPTGGFGGNEFMAQNAGTSGATEPAWPAGFGATIADGTITWINVGQQWTANSVYPAGATVRPNFIHFGFNFQATTGGTSGGTQPVWPTTPGATVNDNGILWKAIGFYPGSSVGCQDQMLISRAPSSVETTIAKETDPVGQSQLSGWGEFIAMNASGKVAFRAAIAGLLTEEDESGSGIFTAGPGAGALTKISTSGDVVGGRALCGHSTMVAINNSGQVLFDGLGRRHLGTWQANHAFTGFAQVYPTVANGFRFTAGGGGGTSGATEPVWPTSPGQQVLDGTITWTASVQTCDEDDHSLIRFTAGPGNQLLVGQGSSVGGSTVIGFGSDDDAAAAPNCSGCEYNNIDGVMNASGHVPVVLNLADGTQGVFNFTAPGVSTQVVRTGGGITAIGPRVAINNSDQVVYRATVGGLDEIRRFTPPSTTTTILSVDDTVNGKTIGTLGAFFDINSAGHVVFQGNANNADAFYFWDGTTVTEITTGPTDSLAAEMISINDSDQVAYVTGNNAPEETNGGSEMHETGGVFFWTKAGGVKKAIAVGDVVNGDTVTAVYAQHTSFVKRQFSSGGCIATAYMVLNDDPDLDCTEGGGRSCGASGLQKGAQLFSSCATAACPTITVNPASLPNAVQGAPYNQTITAVGGAAPYTFAVTSGSLPPGIGPLTASGGLSGTPTTTGTFNFTVTATDSAQCTGSRPYTIGVGTVALGLAPPARNVVVGNNGAYTVTITPTQSTPTTVTLTSGNTAIATVPPSIIVPANTASAIFNATGVAVGGPITITADLPASFGAAPATATITVIAAAQSATVPTLSIWGLAVLALLLAGAGILFLRSR